MIMMVKATFHSSVLQSVVYKIYNVAVLDKTSPQNRCRH